MYQAELAQQTLQQIVQRLIESYQPQRIILFGSLAYGEPDEDSDMDVHVSCFLPFPFTRSVPPSAFILSYSSSYRW